MLYLYEEHGLAIDERLVGQYLQDPRIAKDFAIYYDLFDKYRSDYKIDTILAGTPSADILFRAQQAPFDERLSLLAIIFDAISAEMRDCVEREDVLAALVQVLKDLQRHIRAGGEPLAALQQAMEQKRDDLAKGRRSYSQSQAGQKRLQQVLASLEDLRLPLQQCGVAGEAALACIKADLDRRVSDWRSRGEAVAARLDHVFSFAEQAFGEGEETLLLVTELTASTWDARFIARFGSDKYYEHNQALDFQQRQRDILRRIDSLDLSQ